MTTTPNFRALAQELLDAYVWCIQEYIHNIPEQDTLVLRTRAALATPPSEPPTIGSVEDAAKAIYSGAMTWTAANVPSYPIPPWVEGGNSMAQDVARRVARSLATPPLGAPTDEEIKRFAEVFELFDEIVLIRAALERWGQR